MAGIYIHIPFCRQACHYCDFHFSTSLKTKDQVLAAMVQELHLQRDYLDQERVETVYFGGGTPSLLEKDEILLLLEGVYKNFDVSPSAEVSMECNPDDLNPAKLAELKELGINRLSIGVQSFRDEDLKLMNRAHKASEATRSVQQAQEAGFDNLTIDLIYAIPDLSRQAWIDNVDHAISLGVQHISSYCLTFEDGTAFGKWINAGTMKAVEDEHASEQFMLLVERLKKAGIEQYEVSNFARKGYESKHNSAYWNSTPYLGIGPSAHSFDGSSRQWNLAHNVKYSKAFAEGLTWYEKEILTPAAKFNEYMMTGLRTVKGVDLGRIKRDFGVDLAGANSAELQQLKDRKEATLEAGQLSLTKKGLLRADAIASDFFIIES
ncbi:MAG: oxygen-independent coproporphyrinogen-3 oxidase [Flavobacteriales bacterium]